MKLYQSFGPNPRVVLMYLVEKGLTVPRQFIDIIAGENRQPAYLALNPSGGTPSLELDDGTHLLESLAICEYFEETSPGATLLGTTPVERAQTRAALRMIDQQIVVPMTNAFRSAEGLPMFKGRLLCVPDAADGNKSYARDGMARVDATLAGREFVCGDRFTLADILLFAWIEFGAAVGQPLPDGLNNLQAWHARVAARPSAIASANPQHGL